MFRQLPPLVMFLLLVMLFDHLDDDRQGHDKGGIDARGYVDSVAVAVEGELATDLREQVAIGIGDDEVPAPDIAFDVEDHAAAFDLKTLTEELELFMHACPALTIAIDLIMGQQREDALFDLYQRLPGMTIKHHEIVADVEKFAAYLEDRPVSFVTHDERFRQAPRSLANMITHCKKTPLSVFFIIRKRLSVASIANLRREHNICHAR